MMNEHVGIDGKVINHGWPSRNTHHVCLDGKVIATNERGQAVGIDRPLSGTRASVIGRVVSVHHTEIAGASPNPSPSKPFGRQGGVESPRPFGRSDRRRAN
jgi:hypothetical protein